MALDIETYNSLLDVVRRFVDEELIPAEREVAAGDEIPARIVEQMRALGLFGLGLVNLFQRRAHIGSQALPCPVLCGGTPDQYIIITRLPMGR